MEQSLESMRRAAVEIGLYDEDDAAYVAGLEDSGESHGQASRAT
jgi:hypothetical protein